MSIQDSDKLIVGRSNTSYQISLKDSGLLTADSLSGDFVSTTGGQMSGVLQFNTTQTAYNVDPADATAKIVFSNKKGSNTPKTVQLFQSGDDKSLVVDSTLRTKGDLFVEGRIYNWDTASGYGDKPTVQTRNAFINLAYYPEKASLGFTDHSEKIMLEWSLYSGVEIKFIPSGNSSGFRVRGKVGSTYADTTTTNNDTYLLQTYHNSGETDEINYAGRIIGPKNIVTKEYVDDVVSTKVDKNELNDLVADALDPGPKIYDVTDPPTNLEFYQNDSNNGYMTVSSSGNIASSNSSYGIWMTDSMLEKFVTGVTLDEWVNMWTSEGIIRLQGYYPHISESRSITSVERYTYSGKPGVKIRWSGSSLNLSSRIQYFKTENAFIASNPIVDGLGGGGPVEEVETVWTGVGRTSVSSTYPARLDVRGDLTSSSHFGSFFPFEFLKTLHPTARGFNLNPQGASVDNRSNYTTIQLATMNGVDGVKIWQSWSSNGSSTNVTHKFKGIFISTPFDHTF